MASTAPGRTPAPALETPVLYRIRPGDTIARIIDAFYGIPHGTAGYDGFERYVRLYNPHIRDVDRIYAGQMLRLMPASSSGGLSYCPAPAEYLAGLDAPEQTNNPQPVSTPHSLRPMDHELDSIGALWPNDPVRQQAFWTLGVLQERYNWLAVPTGIGMGTLGNLTSAGNAALIREVETLYDQYQRGHISKGQYDGRRRKSLKEFAARVGPFERVLMGGQTTPEAVRINRLQGLPATHNILSNVARLSRMSALATRGGVLLSGVGVYVSCRNIAATKDWHKKNEILVEAAASTAVGTLTSAVIFVALIGNPVGWGVALGLAVGSAVLSLTAGATARHIYDKDGQQLDFVSQFEIDRICS